MNTIRRILRIAAFLSTWFGAWLAREQWVAGQPGSAALLLIAAAFTTTIIAWVIDKADDPWSDFYGIDGDD